MKVDAKIQIIENVDGSIKRILLIKYLDEWVEIGDLNSIPIEVICKNLDN